MELVSSWILTSHHSHTHTHTHTHTHRVTHTHTHAHTEFVRLSYQVLEFYLCLFWWDPALQRCWLDKQCALADWHQTMFLPLCLALGLILNMTWKMHSHTHTHTHTQVRIRLAPNHVPLSLPGSWSNPDYDNLTWKLHTHTHTHWG